MNESDNLIEYIFKQLDRSQYCVENLKYYIPNTSLFIYIYIQYM